MQFLVCIIFIIGSMVHGNPIELPNYALQCECDSVGRLDLVGNGGAICENLECSGFRREELEAECQREGLGNYYPQYYNATCQEFYTPVCRTDMKKNEVTGELEVRIQRCELRDELDLNVCQEYRGFVVYMCTTDFCNSASLSLCTDKKIDSVVELQGPTNPNTNYNSYNVEKVTLDGK